MKLREWNARLHGLVVFRSLLDDPVVARLVDLTDRMEAGAPGYGPVCDAVAQFEAALFEHTTNWGSYLSAAVLEAETVCVRQAASGTLAPALQTALDSELAFLQALCGLTLDELLAQARPPRDYLPGSPVYRVLQHAAEHILPLTIDVDSVDFKAANCQTYHDIARYCHEKAVSAMFTLGSDKQYAAQRIKQLRDKVLKQFWVVNLNDGFGKVQPGPVIDVEDITSIPMQAIWHGMNAYPWQGPPPVDGKGFLSVLFEATANPNLDPAAQTAYFTEKNYFMVSRDYCSLHSRFGLHFVSVEARLGDRTPENYVAFQLRGGAANIERRILRVRFVADLLWEFGLTPVVRNDAVTARLEGMDMEEGQCLLAVAGYLTIHTRQLDMIMQDSAKVAATRKTMLNHCRILLTGGDLSQISAKEE